MHIRGQEWEFMENMTDSASMNLNMAMEYLKKFILEHPKSKAT